MCVLANERDLYLFIFLVYILIISLRIKLIEYYVFFVYYTIIYYVTMHSFYMLNQLK